MKWNMVGAYFDGGQIGFAWSEILTIMHVSSVYILYILTEFLASMR